jgi:hypothetical protein
LIFMSRFASREDAGYVSLQGAGTCFSKSMQFCKNHHTLNSHGCALTTWHTIHFHLNNHFALHQANSSCFIHILFFTTFNILTSN